MPCHPTAIRFNRLLLTGAAGGLGRELRQGLRAFSRVVGRRDLAELGSAAEGDDLQIARLEDADAMLSLLDGVDAVVHLGGVSTEQPWAPILQANIVGAYNLYEAARKQGVRRVVFASSNHVTGFYRQDEVISPRDPRRPDGLYGLSKSFGEALTRRYFARHGFETVCVRIGSPFPAPLNRRMLATWMSYDDLERLVVASLTAPVVGHTVMYGMGDNSSTWWDNRSAAHIGCRPKDSSELFRPEQQPADPQPDLNDPAVIHQGGPFVRTGPFD